MIETSKLKNSLGQSGRQAWSQRWLLLALLSLLCLQSGCQIFHRFRSKENLPPIVFQQPPNQQQIIDHLRNQATKVKQLKTNVRVSVDGLPTLRGTLAVERPSRLRLKAGLLGVTEMGVDVGSNDDFFWVWTKTSLPGEQPSLLYANHQAFKNSPIKQALPLEPSWIIDALGFVDFGPDARHEGPFARPDGRFEIQSFYPSPAGQTVRVSVIDPKHGWISQQAMYDSNGRRVAFVNSLKHKNYPELGVSLPQQFQIHVTHPSGQNMKLVVDADDYTVNSLYGDPAKLWAMPNPQDVPKIDLTRVPTVSNNMGSENVRR